MSPTIILTDWCTHQTELRHIRTRVFIEEQAVPEADEWDGLDLEATHFLILTANKTAMGCARLLTEPTAQGDVIYHIGRVALLPEFRAQGIGRKLMVFIIKHCLNSAPGRKIYLHAQTTRRRFYEQLGFNAQGCEFMDAGIAHIAMWFNETWFDENCFNDERLNGRDSHHG